jgi:hypothetical protein
MEIKNLQTVRFGEGKKTFEAFLTLDLIPFHLIIQYNLTLKEIDFGFGKGGVWEQPLYVKEFYTVEVYQNVIDALCEKFNLPKRHLETFDHRRNLPVFNFKKDDYVYEYQYSGNFGQTFYTKTKVQNALKCHEQYFKSLKDFNYRDKENETVKISEQIKDVLQKFEKQKVFTNRDFFTLSSATLDRFILNFNQRAQVKE